MFKCLGFGVEGLEFRVEGLGLRVEGSELRVGGLSKFWLLFGLLVE